MKATKLLRTLKIGLFAFLCFAVIFATQRVHADVPIPQVTGPIPVTRDSYPFNAANHTRTPLDLSQLDYVEEEYFVSGYANVYELTETVVREMVGVQTADAPYTTRILVRRPDSPSAFSGTVIVELLNPTAGFDSDIQWRLCHDYFIAHGDVWVGITSKPVAVKALKKFDYERYAPLSWENPLPPAQTCTDPYIPFYAPPKDTTPATENGLIWDIMSQVGALLKQPPHTLVSNHPLHGFQVERIFATGYSQTGFFLVTYINFIRPLATAHVNDGTPVYDGYLLGDGDTWPPPLNQCAEPFESDDRRIIIQPRSEPVISVVTQTTVSTGRTVRREDSDSPTDRYRRYEVPGASHITKRQLDFAPALTNDEITRMGITLSSPLDCTEVAQYGLTDFPLEYIMNGAFANLEAWVRDGQIPPEAPWVTLDTISHLPVLDQYGNATAGVRTPYLDVPIATYHEYSTPVGGRCGLMGYKVPFDCTDLLDIYPPRCILGFCWRSNSYVTQVREKVDELVQDGFITEADGDGIISEAETMQSQLPYRRWHCNTPTPTHPEPAP